MPQPDSTENSEEPHKRTQKPQNERLARRWTGGSQTGGQRFSAEELERRHLAQVEWENQGTEQCTLIVFWVPRKLATMPALTTNVEFGRYVESGKILYGRPPESEKKHYLDWLCKKFNPAPIYENLADLLRASIASRPSRRV